MKHGDIRNHRTETSFAPVEIWRTTDGQAVPVVPSSITQTVSERYCERCGWIEQKGVIGALTWIAHHEDHNGHDAELSTGHSSDSERRG